mmetsp:Transcript_52649/g.108732  ORF Transcript_52649/g.108732 Transcript_52649/m.108732 type:complete len:95 (+) Transcript_52649:133-417(+)
MCRTRTVSELPVFWRLAAEVSAFPDRLTLMHTEALDAFAGEDGVLASDSALKTKTEALGLLECAAAARVRLSSLREAVAPQRSAKRTEALVESI